MSKASEWAKEFEGREREVRSIRHARPAEACLHLSGAVKVEVAVDDRGRPEVRLATSTGGTYLPELDKLLAFARAILDTFGPGPQP